jgi:MFS transporter, DHA3 family, macrolide efflux protein
MKKFFVLWISQAFSLFGSSIVEFALAWYLTIKTGSATILATAMLMAFLPPIILGPLIGPFVDRWDRKWTMVIADLSISVITLALVALFWFDAIQVWHIYVAMILRAVGQSVHFPAMQAAVSMIVPEKHLSRAAGLNQMVMGVVTIAGPPAGALFLGLLPMQGVLAIDIVTAILAVACLLPMLIPHPVIENASKKSTVFADMADGFKYIWGWKGLRSMVVLSAIFTLLLVPPFTLLPIFVTTHLDGDVIKLGWLDSTFGVGMIAGGLLLGAWGGFKNRVVTCLIGVLIAGASTIGLGFTTVALFFTGLISSFLVGTGLSICNAPIMAAMQSIVAKEMQGRIFSLMNSIGSAVTPLGLIIAGPTADAIGIRTLFYICGGLVVLVALISFFIRPLMNLEKNAQNSKK